MSRRSKAIWTGLGMGLLGLAVSVTPLGISVEENIGLPLLFKLRGALKAPQDVVVVAMESASINHLNLPSNPTKWPRSLHARIIDIIAEKKAAVIAFDVFFSEARSPQGDDQFARAIQRAGNVVLIEKLEKVPLFNPSGTKLTNVEIEESVPPFRPLAASALATAPFALPKIPVKLNSYWTFKTSAGDTPSLPVVVFQAFALQVYDELIGLLKKAKPSYPGRLPVTRDVILSDKRLEELMLSLKNFFEQNPAAAEEMLAELEGPNQFVTEAKKRQLLKSVIRLYQGPNSRFLNFYGPPGTISTVPYYQLLESGKKQTPASARLDLKDKVVFIGLSERLRPEEEEGFYTVYSQSSGIDISGVEIAATVFANLLEDRHVQPLNIKAQLVSVFLWGAVLGFLCVSLTLYRAAGCILVLSLLYLLLAYFQFTQNAIWWPLVIPLLLQSPLSFLGTTIWKYIEADRERQNIRATFEYYLPAEVVDHLAKSLSNIQKDRKLYGPLLFSDAEGYTKLSESLTPEELSSYMKTYFKVIFEPIRKNSGAVIEVKGDSVLAAWPKGQPDETLRNLACHAALEIVAALDEFNRSCDKPEQKLLRTRIGMHYGEFRLSDVKAINSFKFEGDSVNTASRIEGLNKYLKTQILVSKDVLDELDDFLVRRMGQFIFLGKSKHVMIYELRSRMDESDALQKNLCEKFALALDAYRQQAWNEAIAGFGELMKRHPKDEPARIYLDLCENLKDNPPARGWNGVIRLDTK